ncbi:MAG: hypothetical protein SFT68_00200 [Rickettsiaceae bacterium]|nr:hypothetical protein [Rickettsiaceae bacterium]
MAIISKLKNQIFFVAYSPVILVKFLMQTCYRAKKEFADFIHHLSVLREANISLGKYHLQKGHYTDAVIRFTIIDKFFAPKDQENLFWLGFTFVAQKKYAKALKVLENNSYDNIGLANYIANMSSIGKIPREISLTYDAIFRQIKYERYYSNKINLFEKFTSCILPLLPSASKNLQTKYTLLEISSNPFWAEELVHFLPANAALDTLNFDAEISGIAKSFNQKTNIYREIFLSEDIISAHLKYKYDFIISFDSLSRSTDLASAFKVIKSMLAPEGLFAFVLPKGDKVRIEPNMNHFVYSKDYIQESIKMANLKIVNNFTFAINAKYQYFIILVQ